MRIALGLPSRIPGASSDVMLEWIAWGERGPFSSVAVTDRVVSQALEPLTVLALAAGATKRIRLMTSVVIGPTRETTLLAGKLLASMLFPTVGSLWASASACGKTIIKPLDLISTAAAGEWMSN